MSLESIKYSEYENDSRYWAIERCDLTKINLIVGRNATGKSRLVQVIKGLCDLLSGKKTSLYDSGHFEAEINLSEKKFRLDIKIDHGVVSHERLFVNDIKRLERKQDGSGEIYYDRQQTFIDFQCPQNILSIQQRRDNLQHPFIVEIAEWAQESQLYLFGSALGKDRLWGLATLESALEKNELSDENDRLIEIYTRAYQKHGADFDDAIIRDMRKLDYHISSLDAGDLREILTGLSVSEPLIGLSVIEEDRQAKLPQIHMSQGMFRALAILIHMNSAVLYGKRTLVLVDDIGEGLDFERSSILIDILIEHAKKAGLQLIMTSNDRFVMNKITLEYWSFLQRTGSTVSAYTERNQREIFNNFKFMGLSNFDFFKSIKF